MIDVIDSRSAASKQSVIYYSSKGFIQMSKHIRCLYDNVFSAFLQDSIMSILGELCDHYHGNVLTTTREAWGNEIVIMQDVLSNFRGEGRIIFEYDIPRLGKRVDVVLLYVFCKPLMQVFAE